MSTKINYYLDCRRVDGDGRGSLKLSLRRKGEVRYCPLNISLRPEEWDARRQEITRNYPGFRAANIIIHQRKLEFESKMLELAAAGLPSSPSDILACFTPPVETEEAKPKPPGVAAAFVRWMELKQGKTRACYQTTLNNLRKFCPDFDEVGFGDVTRAWLTRWDAFMRDTMPSANARAVNMRNLRAVFNFAIDEGLTTDYPFRRYSIKTEKTRKRSLSVDDLRRLASMEVAEWQREHRDMFLLVFMLCGINIKDLYGLKRLAGDRVEYVRAKTKRRYSIKVEPEAMAIIDRYRGRTGLLAFRDRYNSHAVYLSHINHALQSLGSRYEPGMAPEGEALWPDLTTYWARHSWATIARSIGVSIDDIALALGHGDGHALTHIYLDEDLARVDEANRRVIDWVLYGKK